MSSDPRIVLCMKWGTKYGPEYVNRLYAMVRRHLRGDFGFVCLTDRSEGIRAEVMCRPIPPLDLPPGIPERGWNKLTTFAADLHGLSGTALFLDLDVVIVGDITPLFEAPGEFLIIHDWKRPWRVTGNSSVYRWRLGAHADLLQARIELEGASGQHERLVLDHLQRQPSLSAAAKVLELPVVQWDPATPQQLRQVVAAAARPLQRYRCAACGFEAHHYFWQCPGCQGWDTYPPRRLEGL